MESVELKNYCLENGVLLENEILNKFVEFDNLQFSKFFVLKI